MYILIGIAIGLAIAFALKRTGEKKFQEGFDFAQRYRINPEPKGGNNAKRKRT